MILPKVVRVSVIAHVLLCVEDDDYDNNDDEQSVTMTSTVDRTSHDPPQVVPSIDTPPQPQVEDTLSEEQKREQLISLVKEFFPSYKPDSWLRCSLLYPPKPSSIPRPWQDARKPQKRAKPLNDDECSGTKRLNLEKVPPPEMCLSDDEVRMLIQSMVYVYSEYDACLLSMMYA